MFSHNIFTHNHNRHGQWELLRCKAKPNPSPGCVDVRRTEPFGTQTSKIIACIDLCLRIHSMQWWAPVLPKKEEWNPWRLWFSSGRTSYTSRGYPMQKKLRCLSMVGALLGVTHDHKRRWHEPAPGLSMFPDLQPVSFGLCLFCLNVQCWKNALE